MELSFLISPSSTLRAASRPRLRSAGGGFESSRSKAEGRCESCERSERESTSASLRLIPSNRCPPKARRRRRFGGRQGKFGVIPAKNRPIRPSESTIKCREIPICPGLPRKWRLFPPGSGVPRFPFPPLFPKSNLPGKRREIGARGRDDWDGWDGWRKGAWMPLETLQYGIRSLTPSPITVLDPPHHPGHKEPPGAR